MYGCAILPRLSGAASSAGSWRRGGWLLVAAMLAPMWNAGAASATGTLAGSAIESTATATFTSGSYSDSVTSNTASVRVDELIDLTVVGADSPVVMAGASAVPLVFRVTNTGNGPEAFRWNVLPAAAGNSFDLAVDQVALDSNGNGIFDAGLDQVLPEGSETPPIPADTSRTLFVLVRLPAGASDGQTSNLRLTISAGTGSGAPGTVYPGQGLDGTDAVVGASGGERVATAAVTASLASVMLSKTALVRDQFGSDQPVPGATITYRLKATVAGTGQVENLVLSDTIPAGTTYVPGTLRLDDAPLSDADDGDAGRAGPDGIAATIPHAGGGTTRAVSFDVKIN